jgi:hypothetical protein
LEFALALPLGLVDRIDPVLDFHDNTAVLLYESSTTRNTLSGLDGECSCVLLVTNQIDRILSLTILARTAVHLESLLVRVDVELDAGPRTGKRCDGSSLMPVVRAILSTVDQVAVVVTCAIKTAVAKELGRSVVGTNLFGR